MLGEFILRLCLAGILGVAIGLEREYRAKEAGFRTHFLVAIGSALIMIVSQYGFAGVLSDENVSFDPSRVAAQVVSGIGFIGAGTIIIQKQFVRGLTTAAGVWATSGIGLAIGGGLYGIGIFATLFSLLGLELLNIIFKNIGMHSILIQYSTTTHDNLQKISEMIKKTGGRMVSYEAKKEQIEARIIYHVTLVIKSRNNDDENNIVDYIQHLPDLMVEKIE
ncbi:MgtC/SapB family protein [Coprobacter tertius]|uniref:MgtC/SapB family protein n=1 Tax=Coprobacter tertius TaxID=2944915 RepID=A0ABT1MIP9_9BACT|nr:MgtC/SapB family protein [Coprobacter tertius]MCP9612497.1 MgtC/SapB family protein [Coprobacter tertius]